MVIDRYLLSINCTMYVEYCHFFSAFEYAGGDFASYCLKMYLTFRCIEKMEKGSRMSPYFIERKDEYYGVHFVDFNGRF